MSDQHIGGSFSWNSQRGALRPQSNSCCSSQHTGSLSPGPLHQAEWWLRRQRGHRSGGPSEGHFPQDLNCYICWSMSCVSWAVSDTNRPEFISHLAYLSLLQQKQQSGLFQTGTRTEFAEFYLRSSKTLGHLIHHSWRKNVHCNAVSSVCGSQLDSDSGIQLSLRADLIFVHVHSTCGALPRNTHWRGPFGTETRASLGLPSYGLWRKGDIYIYIYLLIYIYIYIFFPWHALLTKSRITELQPLRGSPCFQLVHPDGMSFSKWSA